MHRPYWSEVLDHLGLVAGMFDELGIGDVLDRTLHHNNAVQIGQVIGGGIAALGEAWKRRLSRRPCASAERPEGA
jgi:hypothetical protein